MWEAAWFSCEKRYPAQEGTPPGKADPGPCLPLTHLSQKMLCPQALSFTGSRVAVLALENSPASVPCSPQQPYPVCLRAAVALDACLRCLFSALKAIQGHCQWSKKTGRKTASHGKVFCPADLLLPLLPSSLQC